MGLSEAAFALPGPLILILSRVVSWSQVGDALRELGPTVLFLAGILLFGHLCAEAGVFDYLGAVAARIGRGQARRLLGTVVALAAGVTAVLTLDATVVLLTPSGCARPSSCVSATGRISTPAPTWPTPDHCSSPSQT